MFTEESFENVVIQYLKELNYDYIHGSNLTRDNKEYSTRKFKNKPY